MKNMRAIARFLVEMRLPIFDEFREAKLQENQKFISMPDHQIATSGD